MERNFLNKTIWRELLQSGSHIKPHGQFMIFKWKTVGESSFKSDPKSAQWTIPLSFQT